MQELLAAILEDTAARDDALTVVASQASAEFSPWASGVDGQ